MLLGHNHWPNIEGVSALRSAATGREAPSVTTTEPALDAGAALAATAVLARRLELHVCFPREEAKPVGKGGLLD